MFAGVKSWFCVLLVRRCRVVVSLCLCTNYVWFVYSVVQSEVAIAGIWHGTTHESKIFVSSRQTLFFGYIYDIFYGPLLFQWWPFLAVETDQHASFVEREAVLNSGRSIFLKSTFSA